MLTAFLLALRAAACAGAEDLASSGAPRRLRWTYPPGVRAGYAVAYDAYGDPARIPSLSKEPYNVVTLPGPTLARANAAGQLRKIEKARIANARQIAPEAAAKLATYASTVVDEIVQSLCDHP